MIRLRHILAVEIIGLCLVANLAPGQDLEFTTRRLVQTEDAGKWKVQTNRVGWSAPHTAAVVCDMWDRHWCASATARVAELAPRMDSVLKVLRARGALIIHCPSDTMRFYADTPGRRLAEAAPAFQPRQPLERWCSLDPAKEAPLPIDDSDGGCDDELPCKQGKAWSKQIESIEIHPGDAITDSAEAYNLMRQRRITNVLVMGVHQNMCVLGRPFSIRQMVNQGQNVLLVRDLTDSMYNPRKKPFVDHFTGNDLVTWHIEKYWCPTITSDQVIGGVPFRFSKDTKPVRTFSN